MPAPNRSLKAVTLSTLIFLMVFVNSLYAEDNTQSQAANPNPGMMNPTMHMMNPMMGMMNPSMYMNMMNPMMMGMNPMMNPMMMNPMMGGYNANPMGQSNSSEQSSNWFTEMMKGFTSE